MDPATLAAAAVPVAGSVYQNIFNAKEGSRARRFAWSQQIEAQSFAERMAGTSWQRAVADMEAAGINPAVAFSQGGAHSPGGSPGGSPGMVSYSNPGSSAVEAAARRKSMDLLDQQIDKTRNEANTAKSEAAIARRNAENVNARWSYYFDENGVAKAPLRELLNAEHDSRMASSAQDVSNARLARLSIPEREAVANLFKEAGSAGKAFQIFGPALMQLLLGRR